MSSRFFIYYGALCGGWAAFVGFLAGMLVAPENPLGRAGILGMFFGLTVSFTLGCVDAVGRVTPRQAGAVVLQGLAAAPVGALAGLLAGILGQLLSQVAGLLQVLAWSLAGAMIGTSVCVFEFLDGAIRQIESKRARRNLVKRLVGGTLGGLLGGLFAVFLTSLVTRALRDRDPNWLWSPRAMAFVALGMCIGLFVSLAHVFMKDE